VSDICRGAAVWRSTCGAREAAPGRESIAKSLESGALRRQSESNIAINAF
jgi:hypothetical protein